MIKELKDIKPIVTIPDNSLVILLSSFLTLVIIGVLLYLLLKPKRKRKKKPTKREINLKKLKNLDYSNKKQVAYTFTTLADEFLDSTTYENIKKELQEFKYKKDTPKMPQELKQKIKQLLKDIK